MNALRRNGFTMTEMLVAVFVGMAALAAVALLMSVTVRAWRDVTAKWYMTENARFCREKILRGPDGIHGLRETTLGITIPSGSDAMLEYFAQGTNRQTELCYLYSLHSAKTLNFKTETTQPSWARVLKTDVSTDRARISYDADSRVLTYVVTNWYAIGGATNRHVQTLRVPVINE